VALAVLLNAVAPLMPARQVFLGFEWSIALFLASLVFLKWQSTPSVPSKTYRTRGSES
jgi:hypothetical protein